MALTMSVLLLGMGLAIDTGILFVARRDQQAATDAGAWAGAIVLFKADTATNAIAAARTDATENRYTNGVDSTTVTVVSPPTSGEFAGNALFVEVRITRTVRTVFLQGAAAGLSSVTTSAVAGATPVGKAFAILTLGDSARAFHASGSATINVTGAGVMVNASDTTEAAFIEGGQVNVTIESGHEMQVVGVLRDDGASNVTGTVVDHPTVTPKVLDPFAAFAEPSITDLIPTSQYPAQLLQSGTHTLQPGVYDGGIVIESSATVTMQPGNYIIRNGGFRIAGSASLTANGVFIFNTVADHPLSTGSCGPVSIAGSGSVIVSAPTSGPYKGMVLWQDRDCTQTITWTGNSGHSGSGTFYVPAAKVDISGSAGTTFGLSSQIVSNTLSVRGGGTVNLTYSSGLNATPLAPALVD